MARYQGRWTIVTNVLTQGDTGTPSIVQVLPKLSGSPQTLKNFSLRCQVTNQGGFTNATNATIAPTSGYGDTLITHTSGKDLTIKNNQGVAATGVLTVAGVVIDGETCTLGSRVYEFDTNGAVTAGRTAVDISGGATASQGTLTIQVNPTVGDSMTIGTRTYVYVAIGTADQPGEISVGGDAATTQVSTVAAINGTDGFNTPNTAASAGTFAGNESVITANTPGTAGDAVVTTETFSSGSNVFDAATLGTTTAGVDCIAATAITALVGSVVADSPKTATAADGAGDTVDVTATLPGTAGNSIATTETMANGSFAGATLTGGENPVTGEIRLSITDASQETVTLRFGPGSILALPMDYEASQDITHAAP
jgi:hypothetical protein